MGWWEAEDGLTLGDGPLDAVHRVLRELAGDYTEALGRPPSLAELERTLALVLDSVTPDLLTGLEDKSVTGVSVKTKKGPKRYPYAERGDLFAVPLPDDSWGFGRVLSHVGTAHDTVVEILQHRSRLPVAGPEVAATGRLMAPMEVPAFNCFVNGRWPVLAHDPEFRAPDHDELRFSFWQGGDHYTLFTLDREVIGRDLSAADLPAGHIDLEEFLDTSYHDTRRHEPAILAALDAAGITLG